MSEIGSILSTVVVGDANQTGTLRHLASIASRLGGEKTASGAPKSKLLSVLEEFYDTPGRFTQIWNKLSEAEHKILSYHVWSKGNAPGSLAKAIAEEYGLKKQGSSYYYSGGALSLFLNEYTSKTSLIWLLFPSTSYGRFYTREIAEAVGEMKRKYSTVEDGLTYTSRENRTSDFASIVRFSSTGKLSVTKGGSVSKAVALKLKDFCGYEDYAADADEEPEGMRTADGLLVTFPLVVFSQGGGLVSESEGKLMPGSKAPSLLNLPREQLIKKLFDAYLKNTRFREVSIIKGVKETRGHHAETARQNFVEELKLCPVGEYVYSSELEDSLILARQDFGRVNHDHIDSTHSSFYDDSYGADWDVYEEPLIYMLLTFFGALGILDIVWGEKFFDNCDFKRRIPTAFRINPLGAYVLGLSDSYEASAPAEEKVAGGFTVLPDYTIVVPESADRIKHEIYFERFFTKISGTEQASMYRLDFETAVRAVNGGISLRELHTYLSASDKPLPENVARALTDWAAQAERIKIRQVTILECDDEALLEEVIRYKGMGTWMTGRLSPAVTIDGSAASKVKKAIERNKRFCVWDA